MCTEKPQRGDSGNGVRLGRDARRARPACVTHLPLAAPIPEYGGHQEWQTERNGSTDELADGVRSWFSRRPGRVGIADGRSVQTVIIRSFKENSAIMRAILTFRKHAVCSILIGNAKTE
jgi:hypothetical protein